MASAPPLAELNFEAMSAESLLRWAYEEFGDALCLTCSWQKQSSVLVHMVSELGLTHVEISDGVIDLPRERKLELIAEFARDFTVLSEVGSKDSAVEFSADEWTTWLREELDAGAWKVIAEAREGGSSGIFTSTGAMRTELVAEIADTVALEDVVFEAPTKAAQVWFIKQYGPSVNLGNIPPEEVIPLETLRRGLRGDTLKEILLGDRAAT